MDTGYDCAKPDLVVMNVATKIGITKKPTGENNLKATVRTIQEYSLNREIRPPVVDLYFLIYGKQKDASKYVEKSYYQ